MKHALLVMSLIAVSSTFARQAPTQVPAAAPSGVQSAGHVAPLSDLDQRIRGVLQAKDSALWLWTSDQGVYRLAADEKGKTLVRFTTEHGLSSNQIGSVQEDRAGNLYVLTAPGVLCRFDGRAFTPMPSLDPSKSEWKLGPDDLWFPAGQDTGAVYRWDGASLHRLKFPPTAAGDAATLPRDKFPNAKYSPYDVYTIFKDSKGRMWFGTAVLGACCYDGTSFAWAGRAENESFGVRGIVEDSDGKFWLSNTLFRFAEVPDPPVVQDPVAREYARYRKEKGIGTEADTYSHFVSAVRDKDGHVWLAIMGGAVCRYDGATWTKYLVLHEGKPIWINRVYRDRQDRMWVSTNEHGLYRLEGGKFESVRF